MTSTFIWYELLTSDPDAAAAFYGDVLGWTARDSGQPGVDYRMFSMREVAVGGLMKLPAGAGQMGVHPCWLGYISVADVDHCVARIVAAGGVEHMPAMEIPGIGRIAMVADPQGASFYVMKPIGTGPATSFAPGSAGHGGWHELHAADWESALAFYSAQFGWQKCGALDMGAMGTYLQFNFGSGAMVGGMMNDPAALRPHWIFVFNVDDIDLASQRLAAGGGQVLMQPHQVPTGQWVMHARDPQGARFALLAPSR